MIWLLTVVPFGQKYCPMLVSREATWGKPKKVIGDILMASSITASQYGIEILSDREGGRDPSTLSISTCIFSWHSGFGRRSRIAHSMNVDAVSVPSNAKQVEDSDFSLKGHD